VQQALALAQTPRFALNRMVHRGLLVRVAPGVYGLAESVT
jgi:hypothetical protein